MNSDLYLHYIGSIQSNFWACWQRDYWQWIKCVQAVHISGTILLYQRFSYYGPLTTCDPRYLPLWPFKNTEEKLKFRWIAYNTIGGNLRFWKWLMGITFDFFSQNWHFMKFITLPFYRLPTLLSATKEGFKALWTWCFSPSFPCTFGAVPIT